MRRTTLAFVISSMLLAAAARAEPPPDPATQAPATQATPSTATAPATPEASPGAGNDKVGAGESNVDEPSTSGSYYPYSAGTAGDDPAKPTSTAVPPDKTADRADHPTTGALDRWLAADTDGDGALSQPELTRVAPTLSASFGEMDVNGDERLTRDEFKAWHESKKAAMDADEAAAPPAPATSPTTPETPRQ